MSLPGRWTDDAPGPPAPPEEPPQPERRQFRRTTSSDPAVTQFCNEHIKDLDDLQNVSQLITSLTEQQSILATKA
jgi:hypothetical protein